MKLQGKTALVTGGGTGIGLGIAQALSSAGCQVAIAGRRTETLQEAAETWSGELSISYHPVDVAQRDSVQELVDWTHDQWGRIDILVNSAGTNIKNRSIEQMDPEQWDQVMAINVTGAYNCIRAVLPHMREQGDGLIVNINSISGLRAWELGGVAYDASKFALRGLGTVVGNEVRHLGIRVTNIYPGEVETPLLDKRPVAVSAEHKATILQPNDVGEMVVTIAGLPARAHVPDLTIKPTRAEFV